MSLHFTVKFEQVSPSNFYSVVDSREAADEEFKDKVQEELDVDCSVVEVYSESAFPPYAVFRADFSWSDAELYEQFGKSGMSEIVQQVAENVYGFTSSQVMMERW